GGHRQPLLPRVRGLSVVAAAGSGHGRTSGACAGQLPDHPGRGAGPRRGSDRGPQPAAAVRGPAVAARRAHHPDGGRVGRRAQCAARGGGRWPDRPGLGLDLRSARGGADRAGGHVDRAAAGADQPPAGGGAVMRPRIVQTDDQIGFHWVTPAGAATTLRELVVDDDEPDRLVATHIEALDDALIIAAERSGELLAGGRPPRERQERDGLSELHRVLDLLCFVYAAALVAAGLTADVRAGQIIGTATLFSICARRPLGLLGPAPFDGEL